MLPVRHNLSLYFITFSINLLFSEISEGIVLLSDYQYDKAVLINIDDEIINQWDIPGLLKSYLNPDSSLYSFSRVNNEEFFIQLRIKIMKMPINTT